MFSARLVPYSPAGDRLPGALLDGVSWDASLPLNDVSALSLSYPDAVDPIGLADAPVEIALQVSDGGDWMEPRNARFLSSEVQADLAAELDVPKYSFRGLAALLERPFVLRQSDNGSKPYTNDDSDPKRNFLSASAGQIITSILNESRAKYATMLDGITLGFTASKDSLGKAWNKLDSVAYSAGTDLLRVLDDMTARGICDWWMQGRTLMAANADSAAVQRSLRLNLLEVIESPLRATFENLASHVQVEGGNAKTWERPVSGATVPYGAKIVRVANDSITTDGTALDLIARQSLQATAARREYTRTIALTGELAPGISFECGDWVYAKINGAEWDEVRVHELGLSYSQDDAVISARVTLNDRFVDASVRDAKRLKGIAHGTTQNLGDGGIPSRSDKATPAAPVGVAANSLGYWQDAVPLSSVDVSWQAVTADTNGLALNGVDYYEVTCGGASKRATGTTVGFDGLQPSRIYPAQVRAVSTTGIRGKWSVVKEVLTAYPLDKLDPPTEPNLVTSVGSVETRWDGKLKGTGAAYNPPKHFSHCLVEMQVGGGAWTRYARDTGWSLVGLTAGTAVRVRLVAVDMLGTESLASPVATVTVISEVQAALDKANEVGAEQLVQREKVTQALEKALEAETGVSGALQGITNLDKDLRPKIVAAQDAANTAVTDLTSIFDDILIKGGGGAIRLRDSIITAPMIVASEALSAKFAEFLTVKASTIVGDNAAINTAFVEQVVGSDAFFDSVTTSRLVVANKWWRVTKSAGKASVSDSVVDASNTPTIRVENGRAYLNDSGETSGANRGISMVKGRAYLTAADDLGSTLLEPGSITTPMLVAEVITAEKMSVGALDGYSITSPLFQSVAEANRGIKWVGNSFVAYNNAGAEMIRLEGNTGAITGMIITGGTIRTAVTGQRFVISTSTAGLPGMWTYDENNMKRLVYGFSDAGDPGLWMADSAGTTRLMLSSTGMLAAFSPSGTQALKIITTGTSVGTSTKVEFAGPSVSNVNGLIYMGSEAVDGTMTQTAVVTIGGSARGATYSFVRVTNGGSWYLGSAGSNSRGYIQLDNSMGALRLYSRSNLFAMHNVPGTSASARPLVIIPSSSGEPWVYWGGSTRDLKLDIQDLEEADPYRILRLRPRTFYDKGEYDRYMSGLEARMQEREGLEVPQSRAMWEGTSKPRRITGLIAEEVAKDFPELASTDDAGQPINVDYDRIPEYLILAMRAMLAETETLKTRIIALETQIGTLQ